MHITEKDETPSNPPPPPPSEKPIEEDRKAAFEQVMKYVKENDQEQLTLTE